MDTLGFALRQPWGGVLNESQARAEIVNDLLREPKETSKSWNLAIPPGFGEQQFLRRIRLELEASETRPILAFLEADAVRDVSGLVHGLYGQWRTALAIEPVAPTAENIELLVEELFDRLPQDRRTVIVFPRFHKILEFADTWVLGKLRTAEDFRNVTILTTTRVTLDEMQRLDSGLRRKMTISNFGDRHNKHVVMAAPWQECFALLASRGIQEEDARWIYDMSGGYPDCINDVVEALGRSLKIDRYDKDSATAVHNLIDARLGRFVQGMRAQSPDVYFRAVVDLHQGVEVESSGIVLKTHEWAPILLDEQGDLRAERLGIVASREAVRLAVDSGAIDAKSIDILGAAERLYLRSQYGDADTLLQQHSALLGASARACVLSAHARIMAILYKGEGPGEDTDWRLLQEVVAAAASGLERLRTGSVRPWICACLSERYEALRAIAQRMSHICELVSGRDDAKVIEILAHSGGKDERDNFLALLLLVLRFEAGSRFHGGTAACQAVLPLPEQAYCLWAWWAVSVRREQCPDTNAAEWQDVEEAWNRVSSTVFRKIDGRGGFSGFRAFAMYALAIALRRGGVSDALPERSLDELNSSLSFFETVRNGRAHTLQITRKETRERFFGLINKWVEATLRACQNPISRDELLEAVSPLPLLDENGALAGD